MIFPTRTYSSRTGILPQKCEHEIKCLKLPQNHPFLLAWFLGCLVDDCLLFRHDETGKMTVLNPQQKNTYQNGSRGSRSRCGLVGRAMKFHSQGNFDVSSMHYIHFVPDDGSFEDTFLQRKKVKSSGPEHVGFDVKHLFVFALQRRWTRRDVK